MQKEFENFFMTYFGAIVMILFGILLYRFTVKNPESKFSYFNRDIKAKIAGVWFILMGIIVIIARLLGKLP